MLTYWRDVENTTGREYVAPLGDAQEVEVSQTINGNYTLTFSYPRGGALALDVLRYVEFEGQFFIITKIVLTDEAYMRVSCEHIFNFYAKKRHIPNIASTDTGDFIGTPLYSDTETDVSSQIPTLNLERMSEAEVEALGMAWVTDAIDFESMDKTTAWDAIMRMIECAGRGELYVDNFKWAIVARIGTETGAILSPGKNLVQYTIEKDISEYANRFYPYGKDDVTIASVGEHRAYIRPLGTIGSKEIDGYKDYSATVEPQSLFDAALWDMDAEFDTTTNRVQKNDPSLNPDALDQIAINVSGKIVDTTVRIGDGLSVVVDGAIVPTRLISLVRHPFDGTPDEISCGHIKKDMYYYLRQVGYFTRQYKKISTGAGAVQGQRLHGRVVVDGAELTADASGNLYINGNKVVTE